MRKQGPPSLLLLLVTQTIFLTIFCHTFEDFLRILCHTFVLVSHFPSNMRREQVMAKDIQNQQQKHDKKQQKQNSRSYIFHIIIIIFSTHKPQHFYIIHHITMLCFI